MWLKRVDAHAIMLSYGRRDSQVNAKLNIEVHVSKMQNIVFHSSKETKTKKKCGENFYKRSTFK